MVHGSYMAANGVSSCGSNWLMNELIRSPQHWNRPDAVVMSDCSAVGNMRKNIMHLSDTMVGFSAAAILPVCFCLGGGRRGAPRP